MRPWFEAIPAAHPRAHIIETEGSDANSISHPHEVAKVIEEAGGIE